jgi:hypothetical protein
MEILGRLAWDSGSSSLERFMRRYLDSAGGMWEEREPQVYDVLLPPPPVDAPLAEVSADRLLRIAFDPEALPEHAGAQLASFGTPFVDELLRDACARGRVARFHMIGLNASPPQAEQRLRRGVRLADGLEMRIDRLRALSFAEAVYWFHAAFVSDQKEEEILPLAIDLHHLRQVRHLDQLLVRSRLAEQPGQALPEAWRHSLLDGYVAAREEALRTFSVLANARGRALADRLDKQGARISRYYADLRGELAGQARRQREHGAALERLTARREAIDREEQLRIAELKQKSGLRVQTRLLQLLIVEQPKLLGQMSIFDERRRLHGSAEVIWDPLLGAVEPVDCIACRRPTLALSLTRRGEVVCPDCHEQAPAAAGEPRGSRWRRG